MRTLTLFPLLLSTATPVLAQVSTSPAPAGEPDHTPAAEPDNTGVGDIVVTAQRRSESVQKVPISVATITADRIGPAGARNAVDLTQQVVGLQINKQISGANPTIFMRGVGVNDFNPTSSGAVGVVVDDVFLASSVGALFGFYDVDRIEVLRGPQGTLFGRNTTGGVLNVLVRKPTWDTQVDGSATYGNFNSFEVSGGIGGAIVNDVLAGRVSFMSEHQSGYVTNRIDPLVYPGSLGDGAKIGGFHNWAARAQLLFTPASNLTVNLKVEGGKRSGTSLPLKSGGAVDPATGANCTPAQIALISYCAVRGSTFRSNPDPDVAEINNATNNFDNLTNFVGKLGVEWNLGAATLHSVSAYVRNDDDRALEQDASPIKITNTPLAFEHSKQFSQEVRLSSNGSSPLTWQVGAYYLHEKLDSNTYINVTAFGIGIIRPYRQTTDSWAVFTQESYKLTDKLTATAGLRFTHDKKVMDLQAYATSLDTPTYSAPNFGFLVPPQQGVTKSSKPTWRLSLDYQASRNLLVYASYNRGYRAGGYNVASTNPQEFSMVKPEKIDSYEFGFKSDLLDRKLRINTSAFYYDYQNQQVFGFGGTGNLPVANLQNANSEIYGGEIEATAVPIPDLRLHAGAAYTHARYKRTFGVVDYGGNTLEKTPTWQLSGDVKYSWDLADNLRGSIGVDASYQTRTYLTTSNTVALISPAHTLINGQLGIESRSGVSAMVWVKNLTNRRYIQDGFDFSALSGINYIFNMPRTYGVTLAYKL